MEVGEELVVDLGGGELLVGLSGRYEYGPVGSVFGTGAVGAFDEGGVEGDDVEQGAEAELLLQEKLGDLGGWKFEFGIDEEFYGVVTGFAVDVDAAGEVGGDGVVEPVVVGEPGVFFGNGDEVAAAFVGDAGGFLLLAVEDLGDAGEGGEGVADLGFDGGIVEVDVGDLVVGDGEGLAGSAVELLEAELVFDADPAALAQGTVDVDGLVYLGDAVFGKQYDLNVSAFEEVDQLADDGVDRLQVLGDVGVVGPEALEIVVEVGKVDEV